MSEISFSDSITFLYTKDLQATTKFYVEVMGLSLVLDQGDCQVFRVSPESYLGFCQRVTAPDNPQGVIFTFVTPDVDGWASRLRDCGVVFEKEPALNPEYQIYNCFFRDPNGYLLEIQRFLDPHWKTTV